MPASRHSPLRALSVGGLRIEHGSTRIGRLTLRRFQEEAWEAAERPGTVVLDAPTGSGKTLAMLLAAERSLEEGKSALIMYPTKVLISDQLDSMRRLAAAAGIDARIEAVDADRLHRLAADKGYRSHGEALAEILAEAPGVFLTNPDTLYYILRMEYRGGRTLVTKLFSVGTVCVDELHLFWGAQLQAIYSMLSLMAPARRLLVSTATHDEDALRLLSHLPAPQRVEARPSPGGDTVRHETLLEVYTVTRRPVLAPEDAPVVAEIAARLYERGRAAGGKPPYLVAIVNSIAFSERLGRLLRESLGVDVSIVNSLKPPEERRVDAPVVVGTSAIEVGVDFDTPALLFEANNAPGFIQRLGRVARRRPGLAAAVIPYSAAQRLAERLPGDALEYQQLVEAAKQALSPQPSHARFMESPHGAASQVAIAYTVTRKLADAESPRRRLVEAAQIAAQMLPPALRGHVEGLAEALASGHAYAPLSGLLGRGPAAQLAAMWRLAKSYVKMGVRGAFTSLPALILLDGQPRLGSVDVTDLPKLDFEYAEDEAQLPPEARSLGVEPPILIVYGLADPRHRRHLKVTPLDAGRPWHIGRFGFLDAMRVEAGDSGLAEKIAGILRGLPGYLSPYPSDWRLAAVPSHAGWLVLGPDALVEAWLAASPTRG